MTTIHYFRSLMLSVCMFSVCKQLHADDTTLCKPAETVIFSCSFKNMKKVSICGSADNSQSYVEYRFGKTPNIELKFRASAEEPKHQFHRGEVIHASNSEDIIWFKNGKYLYSIFMPTRGGPGLEVSRNDNIEARLECGGGWSNVKGKRTTKSKFITEHGSGDLSKFEELWNTQ